MKQLQEILDSMEPGSALAALSPVLKKVLGHLDEEARIRFVKDIVGEPGGDKLSSIVNLWLAECMDEGVDPTDMCQSLVHKVAQSKQLLAVTDSPEILGLFESWLDELEEEAVAWLKGHPDADPAAVSAVLGLSRSGAAFLLAKLEREGKV